MDIRHAMDITPWDKGGNSFMGLTRNQAKYLGLVFIFFGLILADPPITPIPTDMVDIFVSGLFFKYLNPFGWSLELWLLLTYTVVAWSLILLGAWIYPYNTLSLLNGYVDKFKRLIKTIFNHPALLGISIISFYYVFQWYKTQLGIKVDASNTIIDAFLTQPTGKTVAFIFIIVLGIIWLRSKDR